jgi:TrmH family RNA methyltransferase
MQYETITSRNNPTVLLAASLKDKKNRDRHGLFLVDGEKLFLEAVANGLPIAYVFISESVAERQLGLLERAFSDAKGERGRVLVLKDHVFEKITAEKSPQGIVTAIKYLDIFKKCIIINEGDVSRLGKTAMLSDLQDPGNLGAVIRSCAAFGVKSLILTRDCADVYNPKVLRAAMGNLFRMNLYSVEDAVGTVSALKQCGRRVWAAELREGAVSVGQISILPSDVFVIGNEGHGISTSLSEECTGSVYIPIAKGVESLNASVAASVLLWEQARQEIQ